MMERGKLDRSGVKVAVPAAAKHYAEKLMDEVNADREAEETF